MSDLAEAVLPLIRTRADLLRCSGSNEPGRQMLRRSWSRPMDGIAATIRASRTTTRPIEGQGLAGGEPGAPSRLPRGVGTA